MASILSGRYQRLARYPITMFWRCRGCPCRKRQRPTASRIKANPSRVSQANCIPLGSNVRYRPLQKPSFLLFPGLAELDRSSILGNEDLQGAFPDSWPIES
jgi:hypothetical protein